MIVIDYLCVLSKHGLDKRLHGLSEVGIVLGGPLSGSKTQMESSASKHTPSKSAGLLLFLSPLFIFFFW